MRHLLEAADVSFAYDRTSPILSNVGATVESGQLVAIVGPNGSGKSTLLRILSGLLFPGHGRITLDGQRLASLSSRERAKRLAFLPQSVNPAFALTVMEVVCLGRYPHAGALGGLRAHDLEVAERCLRDTETVALWERDFTTLSGGERQRVLLASILAQEPQLLLLDEPTSALDLHHQTEILGLLRRLADAGYGVAVVTHDLNAAARFCDRLLLLSQASRGIFAAGTPREVLTEEILSTAYAAPIRVCTHPLTDTPLVTAGLSGAPGQGGSGS